MIDQELSLAGLPETILTDEQKKLIFKGFNLERIPFEQKQVLKSSVTEVVLNRVFAKVLLCFSEFDLEFLAERLYHWNSDQALIEFVILKIPNLDQIIFEEIDLVRWEIKHTLPDILPTPLPG